MYYELFVNVYAVNKQCISVCAFVGLINFFSAFILVKITENSFNTGASASYCNTTWH